VMNGDCPKSRELWVMGNHPKLNRSKNAQEHSFHPPMLWNTFRDGLVLSMAIPVTEAIEAAHRTGVITAVTKFY
ncbi:hypothetical protein Q9L58_010969, partial [Maublancomyces gigas]